MNILCKIGLTWRFCWRAEDPTSRAMPSPWIWASPETSATTEVSPWGC